MTCYIWYRDTIDIVNFDMVCSTFIEKPKYLKYMNCFIVDDRFKAGERGRQGYFTESSYGRPMWVDSPIHDLPEQFRVQLMLLGVQ